MKSRRAGPISNVPAIANRLYTGATASGGSIRLPLSMALLALCAVAISLIVMPGSTAQNEHADEMDRSIKPGDDFYRYANGGWLRSSAIFAEKTTFDNRAVLTTRNTERVRKLIQDAAASHPSGGGIAQKVGDYYASFMDEDGIQTKGLTTLAGDMAMISKIANKSSLSYYLGATLNTEVDGLTTNADHVFGLWVNQGFDDSRRCLPHLLQGGLGMPDRAPVADAHAHGVAER